MSHSNSSLNCFANCMAKYKHQYILHTQPCRPPSEHLTFGIMAHDVLHKAGVLRDEAADGVIDKDGYCTVIPSEVLYNDLKDKFGISNWQQYFLPIIRETAKYEEDLVEELASKGQSVRIEREVKLQLSVEQLYGIGVHGISQPLVGIIDCLIYTDTEAVILDYKFSGTRKTQDDFDMNSQLPLYMLLVHCNYNIPIHNIRAGYIDIPKQMFDKPVLLTNGTLSRSKSQNVSQEMYEKYVTAIHGDDEHYNCKPGGYYYECWCNLALNKCAYLSIQYIDEVTYNGIIHDLLNAAYLIDTMNEEHLPFVTKYDSYSCKNCEFINSCKPWLTVDWEK